MLLTDFNGLFGDVLCLSHSDSCKDSDGNEVMLHEGMVVTAFDEDGDEHGNPDRIIATGIVARPPASWAHRKTVWVLMIDDQGVMHESNLKRNH